MRRSVLALLGLLTVPAVAVADHGDGPRIDHYVNADGRGLLIANPSNHAVEWERCTAKDTGCQVRDDAEDGAHLHHVGGNDPEGSVFRATMEGKQASSEPWRGLVRSTKAPGVEGQTHVGGWVKPVAGEWAGGWGREADWMQLQACKNGNGTDCVVILDTIKFGRCRPDGGRLIPARYQGYWLKVVDARIDKNQPFTNEGYSRPEGVTPLQAAPARSVAVVAQIGMGTPPAEDCGSDRPMPRPPERVQPPPPAWPTAVARSVIRRDARGRFVALRAECPAACALRLVVRQGRRSAGVARLLPAGTTLVSLPRRQARRLRRGPVTVRVLIDGAEAAERRARLVLPASRRR